jgi:hypothetical protein
MLSREATSNPVSFQVQPLMQEKLLQLEHLLHQPELSLLLIPSTDEHNSILEES